LLATLWYGSEGVRINTSEPIRHLDHYFLLLQVYDPEHLMWLIGIERPAPLPQA